MAWFLVVVLHATGQHILMHEVPMKQYICEAMAETFKKEQADSFRDCYCVMKP